MAVHGGKLLKQVGATQARSGGRLFWGVTFSKGENDDWRTIYSVLCRAGGCQCAERLPAVCGGVGVVAVRKAGAAMSAALGTIYGAAVALIIWFLVFDKD